MKKLIARLVVCLSIVLAIQTHSYAAGVIDRSFGTGGTVTTAVGANLQAKKVKIQPDGKILVLGAVGSGVAQDTVLIRYNANGSLDTGFGSGGIVTTTFPGQGSYAFSVALQPDGKILVAGTAFIAFSSDDSSNTDFAIARYHPDGTLDASFGLGGKVATDFDGFNDDAFAVLVQPDGKIVAVGSAKNPTNYYDFGLARYLANGTLDTTFGNGGKVRTDFGTRGYDQARSAVLQPDGRIVAAGFAISQNGGAWNFAVARYGTNGALDGAFSGDGKTQISFASCCQQANRVLLQPDGKLIVVGYPNSESSDSDFVLARLNPNGTLDSTFGSGGKVRTSFGDLNGGANGAVLQPDGRIVAVGFQATNTLRWAEFALARYLGSSGGGALASAVSRKTHGAAGTFDIALPLSGEPGVENRSSGGRHTLVFTFVADVVSGSAAVTGGVGSVLGSPSFAGRTMTVNLTGVADAQKITVTLRQVTTVDLEVLPDLALNANLLLGDVNADRSVGLSDVSQTRAQIGVAVSAGNFRKDVKVDGTIDTADVGAVRAHVGNGLP